MHEPSRSSAGEPAHHSAAAVGAARRVRADDAPDGLLSDRDCDDEDAESTVIAEDADCDGVLTADDCDDEDAESTVIAADGDCDGLLTADDCDDSDSSMNWNDADGDGYASCDGDCDDGYADRNPEGTGGTLSDRDCDGVAAGGSITGADYKFAGENAGLRRANGGGRR